MYRSEIDGLRALAVIPVVFYHFGLGFPGGWVGVDVFFVISGFLITGLLVRELEESRFSLRGFWERRARRLLPAAVTMTAVCLVAGWFFLAPDDFKALGESAAMQSVFLSNFYFWQQSGYFSVPGELQPLLHTWSLAVEEQFYIIFPLLLLVSWRRGKRFALLVLAIISPVSFMISIAGVYRFPDAAFYLLPSRAWELALGSFLAIFGGMNAAVRWSWLRETLSWVGLICIVLPYFYYTKETPFPGHGALLPCFGALAVIAGTGGKGSTAGRILGSKIPVFIGLISYSLYLWHWPVIVFAKQIVIGELSIVSRLILAGICFGIAVLSWRYIETPFRKKRILAEPRKLAVAALGSLAAVIAGGLLAFSSGGAPDRFSEELQKIARGRTDLDERLKLVHNLDVETLRSDGLPVLNYAVTTPELLVWGDSHCGAILPGIRSVCRDRGIHAYSASRDATIPLLGTYKTSSPKEAFIDFNDAAYEFAKEKKIKHVLLVGSWTTCVSPSRKSDHVVSRCLLRSADCDLKSKHTSEKALMVFRKSIEETVDNFQAINAKVWIMKEVPVHDHVVPNLLVKAVLAGQDPDATGIEYERHRERTEVINGIFAELEKRGVGLLDPLTVLTTSDGICRASYQGESLYYDDNHLTVKGALFIRPVFSILADQILSERTELADNPN